MTHGTLEVLLVSAKGLDNKDFLSGVDPYAILTYKSQEKKSSVVKDQGSSPEWNETFLFSVSSDIVELNIKLMDKDRFTADDFLGEATIPLTTVLEEESVPPISYNVVKGDEFCGEIKVALKFFPQESREVDVDEIGGWKGSSMD